MNNVATLDPVEELRSQVRGAVVPAEAGGMEVREVFNAMHPSSAGLTVRCTGAADVVAGVNYAREEGLPLAVRGGGHSIAGLSSVAGGVLLDLAPMRGVHVDPERRIATVQGGALWGDVDRETQAFGLVAPGGVVSDTGVAGLTLGGGYGWVRRKYGLSVDALAEAQVVGADGVIRTVSAESHPDLFWAIRGGGGNFGVVTSFTFALQPLGPTVGFSATFYPVEEIAEILRGWRRYTSAAPHEVTSVVATVTFPANPEMPEAVHDRPVAIVAGVYVGDPEEGLRVMAPLRELGTPLFRHVRAHALHGGPDRLRPAVSAQQVACVLEVAVPRRAHGPGDRRVRRAGA
jgi:FAD/FMN-containing dehydrogenase